MIIFFKSVSCTHYSCTEVQNLNKCSSPLYFSHTHTHKLFVTQDIIMQTFPCNSDMRNVNGYVYTTNATANWTAGILSVDNSDLFA